LHNYGVFAAFDEEADDDCDSTRPHDGVGDSRALMLHNFNTEHRAARCAQEESIAASHMSALGTSLVRQV
jgi:hypothetical protein